MIISVQMTLNPTLVRNLHAVNVITNKCACANQYVRASRRAGVSTFVKKSTEALWAPKAGVKFLYLVRSMDVCSHVNECVPANWLTLAPSNTKQRGESWYSMRFQQPYHMSCRW